MYGVILRKELLGRLEVVGSLLLVLVCEDKNEPVRSWEKACSSKVGKKEKTALSSLLLILLSF